MTHIYFSHARAVKDNGEPGRESASSVVTISKEGLCPPRQEGTSYYIIDNDDS